MTNADLQAPLSRSDLTDFGHMSGLTASSNVADSDPAPIARGQRSNREIVTRVVNPARAQPKPQKARTSGLGKGRFGVLVLATEWSSAHGGLSTFNRGLCAGLSLAGAKVVCIVPEASPAEYEDAAAKGVELIEAPRKPKWKGHPLAALARKPALPRGFTPGAIVGHGHITGPAAHSLAKDHFRRARHLQVVHVAPDEIEWYKTDRASDAGERADDRTRIELDLALMADRVYVVGPRLYKRYARDLSGIGAPMPIRIDPGFDTMDMRPRQPPPGAPWRVLLFGRMEDAHLKGLDLAAKALALAIDHRDPACEEIELMVRGAGPGQSEALRSQIVVSIHG